MVQQPLLAAARHNQEWLAKQAMRLPAPLLLTALLCLFVVLVLLLINNNIFIQSFSHSFTHSFNRTKSEEEEDFSLVVAISAAAPACLLSLTRRRLEDCCCSYWCRFGFGGVRWSWTVIWNGLCSPMTPRLMSISPCLCRPSHELARSLLLAVLHSQPQSCSRSSSLKPKIAAGQESSTLLVVVSVVRGVGQVGEQSRRNTRSGGKRNGDARNWMPLKISLFTAFGIPSFRWSCSWQGNTGVVDVILCRGRVVRLLQCWSRVQEFDWREE